MKAGGGRSEGKVGLQLALHWTAGTSTSSALSPSPPHWLCFPSFFWLHWSPEAELPRGTVSLMRAFSTPGQTQSLQAGITNCKEFFGWS